VAVNSLLEEPQASISTVATPIKTRRHHDPNVVKVVLDFDGNAIYFSRAPIPWVRDTASKIQVRHLKHLGLYVFNATPSWSIDVATGRVGTRRATRTASLDGNGWKIRVAEVEHDAISVDSPKTWRVVERLLQK